MNYRISNQQKQKIAELQAKVHCSAVDVDVSDGVMHFGELTCFGWDDGLGQAVVAGTNGQWDLQVEDLQHKHNTKLREKLSEHRKRIQDDARMVLKVRTVCGSTKMAGWCA